jgi:integrase
MKTKLLHRVPLSERALAILTLQKSINHNDLVFPSPQSKKILSDMAMTSYLRKHKIQSTTPDRIATIHGFRSSFRDWCSEHGYARDLAKRSLAHTVKNKVEAAYHRTDLLEQRRGLMAEWEKYCLHNDEE